MSTDNYNEETHQKFLFDMYKHIVKQEIEDEETKNNGDWPPRDRLMLNKDDEHLTGG